MKSPYVGLIHGGINAARYTANVPPLSLSEDICKVAQDWADHLHRTYQLTHEDEKYSGGSTVDKRLLNSGINCGVCGENLTGAPPIQAVMSWMNSPGHRRNLLDPDFKTEGIGVAGFWGRYVICQVLAGSPTGLW